MDHLLIHKVEVLRRADEGDEDGTPIMGAWEPLEWAEGVPFGAGRLDTPRDVSVQQTDGSTVTVQKSTVLTTMNCPARELDRIKVTTALGTQEWIMGGITEAEGQHGPHHMEINVSREVNRG